MANLIRFQYGTEPFHVGQNPVSLKPKKIGDIEKTAPCRFIASWHPTRATKINKHTFTLTGVQND